VNPDFFRKAEEKLATEADDILNQIRARAGKLDNSTPDRLYAVDMGSAVRQHAVLIASIEDDKLLFGTKPKLHIGEKSWKAEMQRLAVVAPGTKFVALQIVASVVAGGLKWE